MTKQTTIRLPEDLVEEIDELVRNSNLDRSSYLREILKKGGSNALDQSCF